MHDIDRTVMELESEVDESESEYEEEYESEYEDEYESESDDYETEYDDGEVFDEDEVETLAAELLGVTDDEELEQFLGKLIKKVGRKARRFVKSRAGRFLRRTLRSAAKKALPIVGGAVGGAFGGPAGGAIGSRLASTAGRIFGLELEGLSPEDQEFEVAKQVVRLAGDATKKTAVAQTKMPPAKAVKAAVVAAAKKHAPGLLRPVPSMMPFSVPGGKRSGRWMRRGSRIVLMGV